MVNVIFNKQNNGACSICKKNKYCNILNTIEETVHNEAEEKYDNEMEIVIYRCPEFIED